MFRVQPTPAVLEPPQSLTPEARAHWMRIVSVRPSDFFTEGNLQLLELYCRLLVQLERAVSALETLDPAADIEGYGVTMRVIGTLETSTNSVGDKITAYHSIGSTRRLCEKQ